MLSILFLAWKKKTHILHINLFVSVLIYTLQRYYFIIISFSKCLFCKAYAVNAKCQFLHILVFIYFR